MRVITKMTPASNKQNCESILFSVADPISTATNTYGTLLSNDTVERVVARYEEEISLFTITDTQGPANFPAIVTRNIGIMPQYPIGNADRKKPTPINPASMLSPIKPLIFLLIKGR